MRNKELREWENEGGLERVIRGIFDNSKVLVRGQIDIRRIVSYIEGIVGTLIVVKYGISILTLALLGGLAIGGGVIIVLVDAIIENIIEGLKESGYWRE